MTETISARDANHHLARILREVEAGKDFVVTKNGTPVARIVPEPSAAGRRRLNPEQEQALAETLAWLKVGIPLGGERFNREELYQARPRRSDNG